jgi:hypothetical protein
MKTKGFVLCLLVGIIYVACDDTIGRLGLGVQPDGDKVGIYDTTVVIEARTIEVDSLYARTINGFLGEIYDPMFGTVKSSYLCQFYPSLGFFDLDSIIGNKIDSVHLDIYYNSYIGDSLAPMEVTVYPIVKSLDRHFYTNTDPRSYIDLNNPMAKHVYTARNLNISDSALRASGYFYSITIPLPVKLGQDYLDKVSNNELKTVDEFLDFFPGLYLTNTFGTGSKIAVDLTYVSLFYTRERTFQDENGNDSIGEVVSRAVINVTQEIIQLNKFENRNPAFLAQDNPDTVYVKSPAGVFTELTIPINSIIQGVGKRKFTNVKLSLSAYHRNEWEHAWQFPGMSNSMVPIRDETTGFSAKMLLIEPDSVMSFFEQRRVADGVTSYTTQFNASTYTYDFNNIANLVQNAIEKAPDQDLKLWLIPVQTTWVEQYVSYTMYRTDYITSHYLYPSGVALKKGGDNLKARIIATDLKIDD